MQNGKNLNQSTAENLSQASPQLGRDWNRVPRIEF